MPLHLLGKKSWNVYNAANIERVRRDEQEARAKEEAEEQRQQHEDAANRIGHLRSQQDASSLAARTADRSLDSDSLDHDPAPRKRRRVYGEDDTDRDIRYAREDIEQGDAVAKRLHKHRSEARLYDEDGHLQLFVQQKPDVPQRSQQSSNGDTFGEQVNKDSPWYMHSAAKQQRAAATLDTVAKKNVWGREDGRRQDRELSRLDTNDPLAFMKSAQTQLKRSEVEKRRWTIEKQAELQALKDAEPRRHDRHKEEKRSRHTSNHKTRHHLDRESRDRARPHRHSRHSHAP